MREKHLRHEPPLSPLSLHPTLLMGMVMSGRIADPLESGREQPNADYARWGFPLREGHHRRGAREGLNNPHLGRNAIGCGSKIRFEDLSER